MQPHHFITKNRRQLVAHVSLMHLHCAEITFLLVWMLDISNLIYTIFRH